MADIVCRDMSLFKTAFSGDGDSIPRNSYEDPVTISERYNALLSINCDNAGYRPTASSCGMERSIASSPPTVTSA